MVKNWIHLMNEKQKVMRLIEREISSAEDRLRRAELQFKCLNDNQLDSQYGGSETTPHKILIEYRRAFVDALAMKVWLNEETA